MDPAVDVPLPYVPEMTGDLGSDVDALLGLHPEGFSVMYDNWELERLRDIFLSIVGGLGPEGVQRWMDTGTPSGWRLANDGYFELLAERAAHLIDSPMT